jgi:hypothetical protein
MAKFNGLGDPLAVLLSGKAPQKGQTAIFRTDHDIVLAFTKTGPDSI